MGDSLRSYCDTGIEYATVGFVNMAPEHDTSGADWPSINFAGHCAGTTFPGPDGKPSALYDNCSSLKTDIPYCQSKGVKVILSIGGWWSETAPNNNYKVSTEKKGEEFATFLHNAFGKYDKKWTGPRPFDLSPSEHVQVDGYDFDLEIKNGMSPLTRHCAAQCNVLTSHLQTTRPTSR